MKKFTHLHVHSHYSLLDGLSKIDDMLDYTKELGMDSIALTDHGVMYGIVEFYQKAKQRDLKPILGIEAYMARGSYLEKAESREENYHHLTLLAKNQTGYQNLIKLTTAAHLDGFYYKPRLDKELLKKHSKGLICLSGCIGGEFAQAILSKNIEKAEKTALDLRDTFGKENFYLEVMDHPNLPPTTETIERIAKKYKIPLVATNDSHYLTRDDKEAQDILLCVQMGNKVNDKNRMCMLDGDYSLRSPEEMIKSFKDLPEAIENTQLIKDQINLELKLGDTKLPHYEVPTNYTPETYLKHLCNKRLKKCYTKVTKKIKERIDYELGIINDMGFATYMLIVQDCVNWARKQGITVNTRGSAAGSVVSYLLNITDFDPLKYDLLFERFLNPGRNEMPDIDLDIADHRREELFEYIRQRYGKDHVAQIITFGTMAARAAIRDAGRALDLPYSFCDQTAKMIPMFSSLEEALTNVPEFKQLHETSPDGKKLINIAKRLEGVVRHASTHACGMVITKDPLDTVTPVQRASHQDETIITQYEMHTVEDLGLLKMDFLGLKNLTIIEKTLEKIKDRHKKTIDFKKVPLTDKKTFELLQRGETTAVFQLESGGMKRYLKDLKPNRLEDIIAMVALYRPGPMDLIPDFIKRKHGEKKIEYLHPKLVPILKNTYGIAIYQEQVLRMARDLAGFSLSEADVLRKAVGKKIKELLQEQKKKFIEGCVKNKIDESLAKKLFSFIEPFARYGFNRAHSVSYATIAYRTAYLKANYPAEFMASLLTADQQNTDRLSVDIDECKKMNIEILPPDVNESKGDFNVISDTSIRFGLNGIKNLGHDVVEHIAKEAPFKSLNDFIERVNGRNLNKKSMEALIKSGALDRFSDRARLLFNLARILTFAREEQKAREVGQDSLFGDIQQETSLRLDDAPEELDKGQQLAWEKELLGLYISSHPLEEHRDFLSYHATPCQELTEAFVGQSVRVGGILGKPKKIITKNGQPMVFVNVEDLSSSIEVIVFPTTLQRYPSMWEEDKMVLLSGKINNKDGELKLLCDEVKELGETASY